MKRKRFYSLFSMRFISFVALWIGISNSLAYAQTTIDTILSNQILFDNNQLSIQPVLNQSWDFQHKKNCLTIQGAFYNQSNAVNTQVAHALLFNSFIDETIKERTFKKLRSTNGYEDEARWSLQYGHYSPKLKLSYFFHYTYRNMRQMVFNKESFEFVFAGNKMFEGDTISINDLQFRYVAYNQLQFGLSKTITKANHRVVIGAAISVLQSPQYLHLSADRSSIYTAPYGEYLDVKYNMQAEQANNGAPEFFSFKGTGMSADMHVSYQKNQNWMLRFNVFDVGFIKYSNEINSYKGDSAIKFEGIVIDNILNFTTPTIFKDFKSDSLFKILNIENSKKSFVYIHPVTFQLCFSKTIIHYKGMISIGIQHKTQSKYYPYVWSKFSYACKHHFVPSVSVGFGGYSYYNIGIDLTKRIRVCDVSIGSTNILGLFIPQHFTSSSLYFRASFVF